MTHYYIFVENGKINGCGEAEIISPQIKSIEVSKEIFNNFTKDSTLYVYSNGEIIFNKNHEQDKQKQLNQKRLLEIQEELQELDKKRVRAVCEDEIKDTTTGETWVEYYNKQAQTLRAEYKTLQEQI